MPSVLASFSPATRAWFSGAFTGPTAAQEGAWRAIGGGEHALVIAPTGSGKTLAAFLWGLDRLLTRDTAEHTELRGRTGQSERPERTRVVYVSPLKALGADVQRNLTAPLAGITAAAAERGIEVAPVRTGMRTGDTSAAQRRRLVAHPPEVLITTPESLYLMLTSRARESLTDVETVIVDEVHAVAGTKRGSHLALTLERLDGLLDRPAQRIGLSATVAPVEEVARFLGGTAPVTVVSPDAEKRWDLTVTVPVPDMSDLASLGIDEELGSSAGGPGSPDSACHDSASHVSASHDPARGASMWPHIEKHLLDLVLAHRSTLVFANSRRLAEKVTARLNERHAARLRAEGDASTADRPGPARSPAALMGAAGASDGAPPELAMSHHGSVSATRRREVEEALKTGAVRCVVATSSLELGIDMGDVDLVVQLSAPPSVASALQRVGRAGHRVGEVSHGVFYPAHRGDLIVTAVTLQRMRAGELEPLAVPRSPLDVLAQQTVAACALEPVGVEDWWETVRRSAPFTTLPRSAFEATLDLLAGRYPSDAFAELRPRLVWDRDAGTLTGRPGAQRLAVTSGGTIPDRGLYPVHLVSGAEERSPRRVGELDEEMVYESRVGDVIALGATSWRLEEIAPGHVTVSPAPGQPGRLPFWKGDTAGRPAELGGPIGALTAAADTTDSGTTESAVRQRLADAGLDPSAIGNLLTYVREQREATGVVPTDTRLVVERFRDETGDWRVVLHSPYGARVHQPWALAVGDRIRRRTGLDAKALAGDDAIVVRLPMIDGPPPGADLFRFGPEELERVVAEQVGTSALFAARFRECAARALLLPRRDPNRRSPLWQQRQRAASLLEVAREHPGFPILLETARECLQDVYDLPALTALARRLEDGDLALTEVETPQPSPFARTALFGYTVQFLYDEDAPLAERRASALALDQALLTDLLGGARLRDLLDAGVLARTEAELQRTAADRRLHGLEGAADLLRLLGPLDAEAAARRLRDGARAHEHLDALVVARRAFTLPDGRVAAVEDAARLRDALGIALPPSVPEPFTEPVPDPLGDLVARHARTHGPFTVQGAAAATGLPVAVVREVLDRLAAARAVVAGEFTPGRETTAEWVDAEVLQRLRRRSLAAARAEIDPVPQRAYARLLPALQRVGGRLAGLDGLLGVVDQLAGHAAPASVWETSILPDRVAGYTPALLDQALATGQVLWTGQGPLDHRDGPIALHPAEAQDLTLPTPDELAERAAGVEEPLARAVLETLRGAGGAFTAVQLRGLLSDPEPIGFDALSAALWILAGAGLVTSDTFAPVRSLLAPGAGAPRSPARIPQPRTRRGGAARRRLARTAIPVQTGIFAGRWSAVASLPVDATERAAALAELLLDRYGVVTRGAVQAEQLPGGFARQYRVLSALEETGTCRRGRFVEGLGPAQFAAPATVDRLREADRPEPSGRSAASGSPGRAGAAHRPGTTGLPGAADLPGAGDGACGGETVLVLAATDPANAYGASLPWPAPVALAPDASGHRPARAAGAFVVLDRGVLLAYVERGGHSLLVFADGADRLAAAARAIAAAVQRGAADDLAIDRVNGVPIGRSAAIGRSAGVVPALRQALLDAGFYGTPRGVRMRRS